MAEALEAQLAAAPAPDHIAALARDLLAASASGGSGGPPLATATLPEKALAPQTPSAVAAAAAKRATAAAGVSLSAATAVASTARRTGATNPLAPDVARADAAAALHVAYLAQADGNSDIDADADAYPSAAPSPPPLRARLPLHVFFAFARVHAAEAARAGRPRATERVAARSHAFQVAAQAFRKLCELRASTHPDVLRALPDALRLRDIWILFLVAKHAVRLDDCPDMASSVHAYHLLHAVIIILTDAEDREMEEEKEDKLVKRQADDKQHEMSSMEEQQSVSLDCPGPERRHDSGEETSARPRRRHDDNSEEEDCARRRKRQKLVAGTMPSRAQPTEAFPLHSSSAAFALCAVTGVVPAEVARFRDELRARLPRTVLVHLPLRNHATDPAELRALASAAEAEYQRLLDIPAPCPVFIDERVFVDDPGLVIEPAEPTPPPVSTATPVTPPASPARLSSVRPPGDTRSFIKFVRNSEGMGGNSGNGHLLGHADDLAHAAAHAAQAGGGDALDALAAVASSTPRSPAVIHQDAAAAAAASALSSAGAGTRTEVAAVLNAEQVGALSSGLHNGDHSPHPGYSLPSGSRGGARGRSPVIAGRATMLGGIDLAPASASARTIVSPPFRYPRHHRSNGVPCAPKAFSSTVLPAQPPATPMTTSLVAVTWLHDLANARPETAPAADFFSSPLSSVGTSPELADLVQDHTDEWPVIVRRVRELCASLEEVSNPFAALKHAREACAVYFAALESVLLHESKRLNNNRRRLLAVLRSVAFHKSLLVCSFECVSASYGHRRMAMIPLTLERFDLTPFELSKCIETFVRRLSTLPVSVARHLALCEHRLLEAIVWLPGSPLVSALCARSQRKEMALRSQPHLSGKLSSRHAASSSEVGSRKFDDIGTRKHVYSRSDVIPYEGAEDSRQSPGATTIKDGDRLSNVDVPAHTEGPSESPPVRSDRPMNEDLESDAPSSDSQQAPAPPAVPAAVPETALELFFLKFLAIAADRLQELMSLLCLEAIAEDVWAVIRHCSWEKWQLMVGRHLDQLVMCSVYGVAKVRHIPLTFKDIITQYRLLSHVCEASFHDLVPGTFRDVSLAAGLPSSGIAPGSTASGGNGTSGELKESESRGDIIRFYNHVYIHSAKPFLLGLQGAPSSGPGGDRSDVGTSSAVPGAVAAPEDRRSPSAVAGSSINNPTDNGSNNSSTPSTGATSRDYVSAVQATSQASAARDCNAETNGASRIHRAEDEPDFDRVQAAVYKSPLRLNRGLLPSRRIGSVTVSPMSPHGRTLLCRRLSSPVRRSVVGAGGAMTPRTRQLYAFGESPSRGLEVINRSLGSPGRRLDPIPLQYNSIIGREASIRQKRGDLLKQRGLCGTQGARRGIDSSMDEASPNSTVPMGVGIAGNGEMGFSPVGQPTKRPPLPKG